MDTSGLHRKLISVARNNPPSDAVPYAFEKRIMARLSECKPLDPWLLWNKYFSRAAVCSVVLLVGVSIGSHYLQEETVAANTLSQDVEQTLFAAVDVPGLEQDSR